MSLGQVMIFVSSLEKAKSFYVKLIGLEVAHDMSIENGMLILKNEGAYLTIHEGFLPSQVKREDCRITPIFRVPNIEKTRALLLGPVLISNFYCENQFKPLFALLVGDLAPLNLLLAP